MISISSDTAEKEKICYDKGSFKKKKENTTLSVAFLCTSKPGVIWNSVKEERKNHNLAQPLHRGCEYRARIKHHPGQKSSALPQPFVWVWHGVIPCAQHLPGVHGAGLWGCWLWGEQRKRFAAVHPREGLNQGKSLAGKKIRQVWKQYGKNVPINI